MSQWIAQLHHPDMLKRKSAIAAIARAKDASSVWELEQISQNDPDEHIRAYAAQAVRYIRKQPAAEKPLTEPDFLRHVTFEDMPRRAADRTLTRPQTPNWWVTDLLFHVVVNVLGCLLFAVLIFPRFASAFLDSPMSSYGAPPMLRLSQAVMNARLGELFVGGIILGVFAVCANVLTFRLTHQVATRMFNGANTFPGMLHDTLIPHTIMSAILYVLFFMASSVNPLIVFSTGESPLAFWVTLAVTIFYGAAYVFLGHFVGRAYAFGTQKGFLSIVIALSLCVIGGLLLGALFGAR
ncbi:MAG: hypothetical protein K8I30_14945 [Anaerolineae bacterium]|nr:hypothetical protein [Anaerolineae bacterium]